MNYRLVTYLVVVGVFLVSCLVAVLGLVGAFKIDESLLKWLVGVLLADSAVCIYALFRQFDFRGDHESKQSDAITHLEQAHLESDARNHLTAIEHSEKITELTQAIQRLTETNAQKDMEINRMRDILMPKFPSPGAPINPPKPLGKIDPYAN